MSRARDLGSSINSTAAGKNFIINGGMDIAQRGTTSISANAYALDRWHTSSYGTGTNGSNVSRLTADAPIGFQYYLEYASGSSSVTNFWLSQSIESVNSILLRGKTVTLSFKYKIPVNFSGSITAQIVYSTNTDENLAHVNGSLVGTAMSLANTTSWTDRSITATVPTNAMTVGVLFSTTNNTVSTAKFHLTGVQLEIGSTATLFSRAGGDVQGELTKCQRYYETNYPTGLTPGYNMQNSGYDFAAVTLSAKMGVTGTTGSNRSRSEARVFAVQKRTLPTTQYWDWVGNTSRYSGGNFDGSRSNDNLTVDVYGGPGVTDKSIAFQTVAASSTIVFAGIMWAVSAEL